MSVAQVSPPASHIRLPEFPSGPRPALQAVSPAGPPPRLLDRVRQALQTRHYSRRTEKAYVGWIRRYILFHRKRHPAEMGAPEVTQFLTALAVERKVAASTQNQALGALLFLYREVLQQDLPWLDDLVRAKRPQHLPVVMTRDEVRAVLQHLAGVPRLMALLFYGAGLRLLEGARLRVQDVDFAANLIVVRDGKGAKDRVTMLPAAVRPNWHGIWRRRGASTSATSRAEPAGSSCPTPSAGSTRTPAVSGAGSGSSQPRGSTSTGRPGNGAVITSTSQSPSAR